MSIADKLITIAQNVAAVFNAGFKKGRQAEHDMLWDTHQDFGNRRTYTYAYAYGWDDNTFAPDYDITAQYAPGMFRESKITDLKGILERRGRKMTITASDISYFSRMSTITRFPEIGTGIMTITHAFSGNPNLVSIDKLVLIRYTGSNCSNAFDGCSGLTHIRFNNNICPNSLSFASCEKMDRASFESNNEDGKGYGLIPALYSRTSGTIIVSRAAVAAAFPNRDEWIALCNTRKTWSIVEA